jgi:hypothetical protein
MFKKPFTSFKSIFRKKDQIKINENNNNYSERSAVTLNNIEQNLPLLYKARKEKLIGNSLGNIYISDKEVPYIENYEEDVNRIIDEKISLLEFYTLNNFLYSKKEYEIEKENVPEKTMLQKNNVEYETYSLKLFPFEESLQMLDKMKSNSNDEQLKNIKIKISKETDRLNKLRKSRNAINDRKIKNNLNIKINNINRYVKNLKEDYFKRIITKKKIDIENEIEKLSIILQKHDFKINKLKLEKSNENLNLNKTFINLKKNYNNKSVLKNSLSEELKNLNDILEYFDKKRNYKNEINKMNRLNIKQHEEYTKIEELEIKVSELDKEYKNKINKIVKKQEGGDFGATILTTMLLFISFITVAYMQFTILIKLFINFMLLKCSEKMEGKSKIEFMKEFIILNFQELFISYLLIILSCFLGPFVLLLDNCFTEYLIVFLIGEGFDKGKELLYSIKIKEIFNYLSFKGIKNISFKSVLNTTKTIPTKIVKMVSNEGKKYYNNKKHQVGCIYKASGLKTIVNYARKSKNINEESQILNKMNISGNIFVLKYVKKTEVYYVFNIINLLNNTIYGYIEFNINNADTLYNKKINESKTNRSKTNTSDNKKVIVEKMLVSKGKLNPYFNDFWMFLKDFYKN